MDLYGKVLELERRIEALEQANEKQAEESAVVEKVKAAAKQKRSGKQE